MSRACPNCEHEHGILNRADAAKTHGICKRHFISSLVEGDMQIDDIVEGLRAMEVNPDSYAPDLGEVQKG